MRDKRGRAKALQAFYARQELTKCAVCGKLFIRRRGWICSRRCAERLEGAGSSNATVTVPPRH